MILIQLELLDNHKCGSEMQDYSPDVIPKVAFYHIDSDHHKMIIEIMNAQLDMRRQ